MPPPQKQKQKQKQPRFNSNSKSKSKSKSNSNSLLIVLVVIMMAVLSSATEFDFGTLTLSSLKLLGDAHVVNNTIRLTRDVAVPISGSGRALYSVPVRLLIGPDNNDSSSSSSSPPASFSTFFTFSISNLNPSSIGGGLTFLFSPDSTSLGGAGAFLGLGGGESKGFLAVEFDTLMDPQFKDINSNHVGLDLNGMVSAQAADLADVNVDLKSGDSINAWIDFDGPTRSFNVCVSYSNLKPDRPLLSLTLDLERYVAAEDGSMFVGFSASTQGSTESHTIEWWSFTSSFDSPTPPSTSGPSSHTSPSPSSTSEPIQIQPDNKSSSNSSSSSSSSSSVVAVAGVATAGTFCFLLFAGVFIWFLYAKKFSSRSSFRFRFSSSNSTCLASDVIKMPKEFTYKELKSATKGFDSTRIIGHGAFGTVYRGVLPQNYNKKNNNNNNNNNLAVVNVAVKRCSHTTQGKKEEFLSELSIIGTLRHRNLVRLEGYCHDKGEILLVYDLMPNGSLDKALFESRFVLSWPQRNKILLGVASALAYLHQECDNQVIHRDVKTSNIMLDQSFNARLGDFGLARQFDHDKSPDPTVAAGTMGYLAPEYLLTGRADDKTDVFSFGAVALEVATGRRPIQKKACAAAAADHDDHVVTNLVDWVWGLHGQGRLLAAADDRLSGQFDHDEMTRVLMVGLACSYPDPLLRPTMRSVVQMLSGEAQVPLVPTKKPTSTRTFTTSDLLLTLQDTVSDCNALLTISTCSSSSDHDHDHLQHLV